MTDYRYEKGLIGVTPKEYQEDILSLDIYKLPRVERRQIIGRVTLQYAALVEQAEINVRKQRIANWEAATGLTHTGIPSYRRKPPEPTFMQIIMEERQHKP